MPRNPLGWSTNLITALNLVCGGCCAKRKKKYLPSFCAVIRLGGLGGLIILWIVMTQNNLLLQNVPLNVVLVKCIDMT